MVIASGSSSFDLQSKSGEPLLGRKITKYLLPITWKEFNEKLGFPNSISRLEEVIQYGSYPEILNMADKEDKIEYLSEAVNSLLLKDILMYENIKNSDIIYKIVKLLAEQVGQIVSINEISNQVGVSRLTTSKYINLLKNFYIIFELKSYSRNHRKEISKSSKYYFWDNCILNSLKKNFSEISSREDKRHIWENYIISEMMKKHQYSRDYGEYYFWRNKNKSEVDLVYEKDNELKIYEVKFSKSKANTPPMFTELYGEHQLNVITKENFFDHLLD